MSSERAAKRRKLDLQDNGTPLLASGTPKASLLTTYSKKATPQTRHAATTPETAQQRSKAQPAASVPETFQEAKARVQAQRQKARAKSDVYDDIEGAHAHAPVTAKRKTSTKKKPVQDPLRNQKASGNGMPVQESPRKPESTLGFFKQFHSPKKSSQPQTEAAPNGVRAIQWDVKSDTRPDLQTNIDEENITLQAGEVVHDHNEEDEVTQVNHEAGPLGRKKTLEDEIRELTEAAGIDAKNENEAGTPSALSLRRRDGAREKVSTDVENKPVAKAKRGPVKAGRSVPGKRGTLNRGSVVNGDSRQIPDSRDEMQLDVLEENEEDAMSSNAPVAGAEPVQRAKVGLQHTFTFEEVGTIQTIVLDKLTGKRPIPLCGLDEEYAKVSQVVGQTVTAGESNSMLLIGARGSGKTALINSILREQTAEHADDFHVVRLNGFVHTDDKIALREIWRQLGREMEPENEEGRAKNYADTLTTLLALLSHSSEMDEGAADHVTKSVIFILDEFELFAGHPRQTLLYNLFDIAQSRKAPIAVLGLTTRIDVSEALEKRVKSRFSHRYVHLSLGKSLTAFAEACKSGLTLTQSELSLQEARHLHTLGETLGFESTGGKITTLTAWNSLISELLALDAFSSKIRRIYYTTKSVPDFLTDMMVPFALLPTGSSIDTATILESLRRNTAPSLHGPSSKLDMLSSLSTLQLALLICAARLNAIHNTDVMSFALVYEEYKVLASKAKLQASAAGSLAQGAGARISDKAVARDAWHDVMECGLIMDDGRAGGRVDVGLEELAMSGMELGHWGRWCKEI